MSAAAKREQIDLRWTGTAWLSRCQLSLPHGKPPEESIVCDRQYETVSDSARRSLLHRHDLILHDVILPLRRVLAHVEGEDLLAVHLRRLFHLGPVRKHLRPFPCR